MKLKIWIGPLLVVIILLTLRQMLYDAKENEQQRSVIPAITTLKRSEPDPPMAGTRLHRDSLPF